MNVNAAILTVKRRTTEDTEVVAASGEIDVINISGFRDALAAAAATTKQLVVDLREVCYIDSAGLEQIIVAISRRPRESKQLSILVKHGGQPDTVLHVVQIHTLAQVTSDPSEVGLEE